MARRVDVPKRGHRAQSLWLRERVTASFTYLIDEHGFVGPELHDHGLTYYSPLTTVEILYDERNQQVEAFACGRVGDSYIRARTSCLLVESGLGSAQEVATSARTTHALERSLESQSSAVRRVLPLLGGERRVSLLAACHAQ